MCQCTSTVVCNMCIQKHLRPAIAKAHKQGGSVLGREFLVVDPTIQQNGKHLKSLLYPLMERVRAGEEVDLADKPWLKAGLEYFKRDRGVIVDGTVVKPLPQPLVQVQLSEHKERGIKLDKLNASQLAELDTLVQNGRAFVCSLSGAAFFLQEPEATETAVTLSSVLWKTSQVKHFLNGVFTWTPRVAATNCCS